MKEIFDDISEVAKIIWERGWAERNAGNISIDVSDKLGHIARRSKSRKVKLAIKHPELAGRSFLVKATGSRFRDIAKCPEENMLVARISDSLDGYDIICEPRGKDGMPTSEFPSHLSIHAYLRKSDPEKSAVLHTHPDHLISLTHINQYSTEPGLNRLLWSMHPEMKIVMPEGVGVAPYRVPGSDELADATIRALGKRRLVLWEKHGCIAIGKDVFEAFDFIDTADKSARLFFIARNAGFEPEGLTDSQVDELASIRSRKGRKS